MWWKLGVAFHLYQSQAIIVVDNYGDNYAGKEISIHSENK